MKDKPGILFLPGAGLSSRIWDKMSPLLHYPFLAADYPGRKPNESTKDLSVQDYCDHVLKQVSAWGQQDIIIVAHSIGGVPGLRIAKQLGDRVAGFAAL